MSSLENTFHEGIQTLCLEHDPRVLKWERHVLGSSRLGTQYTQKYSLTTRLPGRTASSSLQMEEGRLLDVAAAQQFLERRTIQCLIGHP
jgi:hypothetical protein